MKFPHVRVLRRGARLSGRLVLGLLLLAALCLALGVSVRPALAHSRFTVTDCRSDAQLQADVAQANSDNAGDVITFACSGDLKLTSTLTISGSMTISGSGQLVTLDGGNSTQVLYVNSGVSLTLNALTIAHGSAPISVNGGGLFNLGTVTISNSTFTDNVAVGSGGGLYNAGTLTTSNSTFANNSAGEGGGLYNSGMVTISNSTFANNSAGEGGGLLSFNGGTLTISNSTFANNSAGDTGGGIFNFSTMTISDSTFTNNSATFGGAITTPTATITNSTIANNFTIPSASSNGEGGGLLNGGGTVSISNSTVANNSSDSGGGIANATGTTSISGSIVADNTGGDCANDPIVGGTTTDGGYNLSSDSSCPFTGTGSVQNTDPKLGPLSSNGGPTQTMALLKGSPAIDYIPLASSLCPTTDQRHHKRPDNPQESACDMGAFES